MQTHSSLRKQNAQWFALRKQAVRQELLQATPHDYQDRNWFYQMIAIVISYPLQTISILAGAYLLFDVAMFVWQLPSYSWASVGVFVGCAIVFLLIELLRRWLVDTVGFHYLATFYVKAGEIVAGEWLRTKIIILACISAGLISAGTFGAYQYSKNHAPQAQTIDIKQATSPLLSQINAEKRHIEQLNKTITDLQQNKKKELADHKSFAVWEGKEYLLPEVKLRHQNYDAQIAQSQRQVQTHLDILQKYEQKLSSKEQSLEQENKNTTTLNLMSKEQYAVASAGIWLCFEALLLLSLAYVWVYRYGVKRELMLEEALSVHETSRTKTVRVMSVPKKDINRSSTTSKIGFEFGLRPKDTPYASTTAGEDDKTAGVPTETVRIERIVETEGFPIICRNCGASVVMRSATALHCSDACRKEYNRKKGGTRGRKTGK